MITHTLFGRKAAGEQLDAELRFHLEEQIAENRRAGMSETVFRMSRSSVPCTRSLGFPIP